MLALAVAEVASSAVAGVASSAVAGASSSAVLVEVASSTDSMGFVDPSRTFGVNRKNGSLAPDGCIEDCGDMVEVASWEE